MLIRSISSFKPSPFPHKHRDAAPLGRRNALARVPDLASLGLFMALCRSSVLRRVHLVVLVGKGLSMIFGWIKHLLRAKARGPSVLCPGDSLIGSQQVFISTLIQMFKFLVIKNTPKWHDNCWHTPYNKDSNLTAFKFWVHLTKH